MTMLGPSSFKKAIEEAEKLSGSLKLRFGHFVCNFTLFHCLPRLKCWEFPFLNRYEEVEVRKKLEEKERQEEKKRKEEIKEKDSGHSSPKAASAANKDSKKVEKYKYFYTVPKYCILSNESLLFVVGKL